MAEEKKDLKEEKTSAGEGQPEEKTKDKSEDDTSKDIDLSSEELKTTLEKEGKSLVSTDDYLRLKTDNENYKRGIISAKAKKFTLSDDEELKPPVQPTQPIKPPEIDDEQKAWGEVDKRADLAAEKKLEARTKADAKLNEQIAIKKFLKENPEVAMNEGVFESIKDEYVSKHGKSVEGIVLDLGRAYKYYKMENKIEPEKVEKKDTGEAEIASNVQTSGGGEQGTSVEMKQEWRDIMDTYEITDEKMFMDWRDKVLKREFGVPSEVFNLLK